MPAAAPHLRREREAWASGRLLVGIDEVGRGPLAGPVVAAAVAFSPEAPRIQGIRDSKVLNRARRALLARRVRERATLLGVGAASPREIDRLNILRATALAMRRAVGALGSSPGGDLLLLLDGLPLPALGMQHDALVDGDAICYSIAAAGIVAKTVRDRLMVALGRRYPGYGWERNMGYATADHLEGLRAEGPSPHHRNSFTPVGQLTLPL